MRPTIFGSRMAWIRPLAVEKLERPSGWGFVGLVGWSRSKFRASVGVDCFVPCPPSVAPRRL